MIRLRDKMKVASRARYLFWRLNRSSSPIRVTLKEGITCELRPQPTSDIACAYEVFVSDVYQCPRPELLGNVTKIVDIGANIGLSCLAWAKRFPEAEIIGFEPHPAHFCIAEKQIRMNGFQRRVTLVQAAAGVSEGTAVLSDAGVKSSLLQSGPLEHTLRVSVIDIFRFLAGRSLDLLKIDIEGYEYVLLGDDRFAYLRPRAIVLEWHNTPDFPDGGKWSVQRLAALGYSVFKGNDQHQSTGLLWGFLQ
jgi:FkbM family methyltransferase